MRRAVHKKGFSVIEIMVALSIFAMITVIIIGNMNRARAVSRDGARAGDLGSIQAALNRYFVDNRTFPTTLAPLVPSYLGQLPVDPRTRASYRYAGITTTAPATNCETYHLGAIMENSGSTALRQDMDRAAAAAVCTGSAADFHGNATNCAGASAAATDMCFDLTPQ